MTLHVKREDQDKYLEWRIGNNTQSKDDREEEERSSQRGH